MRVLRFQVSRSTYLVLGWFRLPSAFSPGHGSRTQWPGLFVNVPKSALRFGCLPRVHTP